jgi:chromosome segregation ATPase
MEKNFVLEKELKKYKETALEGAAVKEQLSALQDEIDVMRHSQLKLQHLEDQYRKVKEKLEQMGDVSKALESEEKAHSEAVSKCLQLENELALLQPLKRQLEEYKARATDAEVRLVDCEDEIKKLREASQNMNGIHNELQKGSLQHMIEAEELRKRLQDNGENDTHGLGVGEGLSELNPELKEELLRLRSENARLREFASKRENDSVQKLEEQKDDSDRLAKKFKEQYLATKSLLEKVQNQLDASIEREKTLKSQVAELEDQKSDLEQELQNERVLAHEARIEAEQNLERALRDLQKQASEEQKCLAQEWESRLSESEAQASQQYQELEHTASHNESRLKQSLEDIQNEFTTSIATLREENDRKIEELSKCHTIEMKSLTDSTEKERSELMERGKKMLHEKSEKIRQLEETIDGLSQASREKEEELNTLKQNQAVFEEKVTNKIVSYKQRLNRSLAEAEENARECDELQSRLKKVESENSNLQQENDRFRRQLGGRFGADTGAYEELKREFNVLLEENRLLKRSKSSSNDPCSFTSDGSAHSYHTRGSVSASSLSALRAEYEDKIEELNDEKRELVLKNTALITEEARVQKRAFELEVEVQKLRQDKISLELQIERKQMQLDLSPEESTRDKNSVHSRQSSSAEGMSTEVVALDSPNCSYRNVEIFSPSLRNESSVKDVSAFKTKLQERLNTKRTSPTKSLSLMDMASF